MGRQWDPGPPLGPKQWFYLVLLVSVIIGLALLLGDPQ